MVKRKKLMDEEVTSEEDEDIERTDDFFEYSETPEETKIRLAKELISQVKNLDDPELALTQVTVTPT